MPCKASHLFIHGRESHIGTVAYTVQYTHAEAVYDAKCCARPDETYVLSLLEKKIVQKDAR